MTRPVLAIAGLTACSGCQLSLLNCERELPLILQRFELRLFPLAISGPSGGAVDVALVEGAVSTPEDLEMLVALRGRSRLLVALGTCAAWGGIAAMKNDESRQRMAETVYGIAAADRETVPPQPLHRHVRVDFTITGCPPEKDEIVAVLASLLHGILPVFPACPVCSDCRIRENCCLLMERGEPCLGPLTQAGCDARCPTAGVACEGCRGPVAEANVASQLALLLEKGHRKADIDSRMRRFCPEWDHEQTD